MRSRVPVLRQFLDRLMRAGLSRGFIRANFGARAFVGEEDSLKMAFISGARLTWPQIRSTQSFQGCWVALDQCRYEDRGGPPVEGTVVDFDADLAALCDRMREADSRHCAILYCEEEPETPAPSSRPPSSGLPQRLTPIPGRQLRH
jgi:hypothetical protein